VLYYDDGGHRRHHTLGVGSLTKADAEKKRNEFMRTVNGGDPEQGGNRPVLLREFVDQKYLPFQRGKWKKSTRGTSENRIQHHIVKGLGDTPLKDFSLTSLQKFLETKADQGLSFSVLSIICDGISAPCLRWRSPRNSCRPTRQPGCTRRRMPGKGKRGRCRLKRCG